MKSFSKAAHKVFLTQASVSERIASLESMVGTQLLDRMGRNVLPTKAGELLYKHALLLLDMKNTACLEMQAFLGLKQGEVHIGGSTIPGEYILPKFLGPFRERYPLLSIRLTIADTGDIQSRVLGGDIELGVVGSRSSHKSLNTHELWKDELVLAVPAGHRWVKKREVSMKAISEEPFILRETGSGTLKIIEGYLEDAGFRGVESLQVVAKVGTSSAAKECVKAGLGISILSSRALETELKAGEIKALKVKGLSLSRCFYLIRDKRRAISPLCRAMISFLLDSAQRKDPPSPR